MLREGAEEATMPTKGQPKKATTSEDSSGTTEARSEADSNLAEKSNPNKKPLKSKKAVYKMLGTYPNRESLNLDSREFRSHRRGKRGGKFKWL